VRVSVPLLYVPPVIGAVNPVIVTVPPVLFTKSNSEVPEKYVPPVICMSVPQKILQRAFSLVTPPTPSIVEPVQALIKSRPACDLAFTVV